MCPREVRRGRSRAVQPHPSLYPSIRSMAIRFAMVHELLAAGTARLDRAVRGRCQVGRNTLTLARRPSLECESNRSPPAAWESADQKGKECASRGGSRAAPRRENRNRNPRHRWPPALALVQCSIEEASAKRDSNQTELVCRLLQLNSVAVSDRSLGGPCSKVLQFLRAGLLAMPDGCLIRIRVHRSSFQVNASGGADRTHRHLAEQRMRRQQFFYKTPGIDRRPAIATVLPDVAVPALQLLTFLIYP